MLPVLPIRRLSNGLDRRQKMIRNMNGFSKDDVRFLWRNGRRQSVPTVPEEAFAAVLSVRWSSKARTERRLSFQVGFILTHGKRVSKSRLPTTKRRICFHSRLARSMCSWNLVWTWPSRAFAPPRCRNPLSVAMIDGIMMFSMTRRRRESMQCRSGIPIRWNLARGSVGVIATCGTAYVPSATWAGSKTFPSPNGRPKAVWGTAYSDQMTQLRTWSENDPLFSRPTRRPNAATGRMSDYARWPTCKLSKWLWIACNVTMWNFPFGNGGGSQRQITLPHRPKREKDYHSLGTNSFGAMISVSTPVWTIT